MLGFADSFFPRQNWLLVAAFSFFLFNAESAWPEDSLFLGDNVVLGFGLSSKLAPEPQLCISVGTSQLCLPPANNHSYCIEKNYKDFKAKCIEPANSSRTDIAGIKNNGPDSFWVSGPALKMMRETTKLNSSNTATTMLDAIFP